MPIRSIYYFCLLFVIIFLSYELYQVSVISSTKSYETKKRPIHVLIISSWRSGSSFIGQIFNHHPNVFYLFEPGHSVWMRFKTQGAKLLHYAVRDLIHSLFTCDVSPLQQYVSEDRRYISSMKFFAESRALCSPPSCLHPVVPGGYNRSICYQLCGKSTFDKMAEACHTYSHRIMKTVRILDLTVLLPLFRDPELDLRIIHLVRDPRAIASSREYFSLTIDDEILLKEYDKATEGPVMATICNAQANISRMVKAVGQESRYMLIRHEDLSKEPIVNAKKIYEFSGLEMTPDLERWVHNVTHVQKKESGFMSFSKQSSKVIQKWRKTMDFKKIKEIEEYCKEAMDLFGYLPVSSMSDLKNMSRDLVL
ncbi:carbohydrate sulfotransferase 4-like [Bufo bufo]|uniref:carbohydrate sulfotransferase 4-like n=1 Tax=Bufo bufo TaxID=8384 RepID=UPI001ABEB0AC|nr:carbohydrate sulfotransferase 4-like [Bufo bufo]